MSGFAERLAQLEERLAAACRRAGRSRESVRLMAVSKLHPVEAIVEAFEAGIRLFGENRVQEFQQKSAALAARGIEAEVHLIGHLQSNKAAKAAEIFSAVDTVDSLRLCERLHAAAGEWKRRLPVLIEIKTSADAAKTGFAGDAPELEQLLHRLPEWNGLELRGLMTVAPLAGGPAAARGAFRQLRLLRDTLAAQYPSFGWSELSMGMSGDFEVAIEEGSTLVRVGTALFGARQKTNPQQ